MQKIVSLHAFMHINSRTTDNTAKHAAINKKNYGIVNPSEQSTAIQN